MGSEKQAQGDPYEHACILNFIPDLDPVSTVRTCHQSLQVIAAFVVGWSLVDFLWRMLQHTNWDIPVQNRNWGCTKQCNWNTHVHKAEHLEYTCAKQKLGQCKTHSNWKYMYIKQNIWNIPVQNRNWGSAKHTATGIYVHINQNNWDIPLQSRNCDIYVQISYCCVMLFWGTFLLLLIQAENNTQGS